MLLFLTGYMGSGKSRYGREAARRMGYGFLDLDELIEGRSGMAIQDIFARLGEEQFRQLESEALLEAVSRKNTVVATGGGTPCISGNLALMQNHGRLVYLQMHPRSLAHRLRNNAALRPLLLPHLHDLEGFITQHLKEREPSYLQADLILKGEGLTGKALATSLTQLL
jgi:shikimate kinase